MKKDEVIYQLTVEDIQNVAAENFVRELTGKEIEKIIEPIENSINWYDIIYDAIKENLEIEELEDKDN